MNTNKTNPMLDKYNKPVLNSYRIHGVTKLQLHSLCINLFHYPAQYQDLLDQYYLLFWSGAHFAEQLKDGVIKRLDTNTGNMIDYLVVYHKCTPALVKRYEQIRLSFRKPVDSFGLPAFVLVSYKENGK